MNGQYYTGAKQTICYIQYNKRIKEDQGISTLDSQTLSKKDRSVRVQTSKRFLERYAREGDRFLQSIITCDELWLHFYDPETNAESMVQKHTSSPPQKKAKVVKSVQNVFVPCFCRPPCNHFVACRPKRSDDQRNVLPEGTVLIVFFLFRIE